MFVFSRQHLSQLLPSSISACNFILDIGSGDGHVSDVLRDALQARSMSVTEMSTVMQRILRRKGYK